MCCFIIIIIYCFPLISLIMWSIRFKHCLLFCGILCVFRTMTVSAPLTFSPFNRTNFLPFRGIILLLLNISHSNCRPHHYLWPLCFYIRLDGKLLSIYFGKSYWYVQYFSSCTASWDISPVRFFKVYSHTLK